MNSRKRQPKPMKPEWLALVQEFPLEANGELRTSYDLGTVIPAAEQTKAPGAALLTGLNFSSHPEC